MKLKTKRIGDWTVHLRAMYNDTQTTQELYMVHLTDILMIKQSIYWPPKLTAWTVVITKQEMTMHSRNILIYLNVKWHKHNICLHFLDSCLSQLVKSSSCKNGTIELFCYQITTFIRLIYNKL